MPELSHHGKHNLLARPDAASGARARDLDGGRANVLQASMTEFSGFSLLDQGVFVQKMEWQHNSPLFSFRVLPV